MFFHGGHCERILWTSWVAYTVTEFTFSCLAWFAICFIYEALKFYREYLLIKAAKAASQPMSSEHNSGSCTPLAEIRRKNYWQIITDPAHLLQTVLNFFQVIISYLIMLVFMNYNYWLCLSVFLGLTCGYFFFGWIKKGVEKDCCH
ncbi:high affinity copper uptake protein 1-like [Teleopsis dalmanni]|uniref:high affinity copper uptake protein 1-like n=1 Tax=Teleopsis dalmanni TaxID=139649 RepID=UPI0018CED1C9|nr:high affinity copper uptake protein 1-like isoform X3 [Teleopsis dalmanni]XP_037952698.1 high affinity copper uptake protein 1-like [Teleopsis dalmanni]